MESRNTKASPKKERGKDVRSHLRKKLQESTDSTKGKNFIEQVEKLTIIWIRVFVLAISGLG